MRRGHAPRRQAAGAEGGLAPPASQVATAEYITDMADELARLADQARLPLVGYLLRLVRIEAEKAFSPSEASCGDQRDEVTATTREPAGNFQFKEKRAYLRGRAVHRSDKIVDANGRWAK